MIKLGFQLSINISRRLVDVKEITFFDTICGIEPKFCFAADKTADANKEALQKLQDFIGEWKGNGGPPPNSKASKLIWAETFQWGWRFKGEDSWLTLEVKDGKFFKNGELKWVPEKRCTNSRFLI